MITEIRTEKEEKDCEIRIIIRSGKWGSNNEHWGIQIDNTITPLYCCNCKSQLGNFYKLDGGRYGQVGTIVCTCGAEIHCTDSDNIVQYLDTVTTFGQDSIGQYHMDYVKMYKLENACFALLKERTGFDIFRQYSDQIVDLKVILEKLEKEHQIKPGGTLNYSFDKITRLPGAINKWYAVLEKLVK